MPFPLQALLAVMASIILTMCIAKFCGSVDSYVAERVAAKEPVFEYMEPTDDFQGAWYVVQGRNPPWPPFRTRLRAVIVGNPLYQGVARTLRWAFPLE